MANDDTSTRPNDPNDPNEPDAVHMVNEADELNAIITEDIPEVYEVETLEQLRAIADELRTRISEALTHRAMTVTQLGEMLGKAPAKVHYHVRELERVKLVQLVAINPKSGILEKYYRAVAKSFTVSKALMMSAPSDESLAMIRTFLDNAAQAFIQATEYTIRNQQWENPRVWGFNTAQIWLTKDEMTDLARRVQAEFDTYSTPRGIAGEEERTIILMGYDPRIAEESRATAPTPPAAQPAPLRAPSAPNAPKAPLPVRAFTRQPPDTPPPSKKAQRWTRAHHMVVAGAVTLKRADLEEAIAQNRQLDISAIGICTFADDITPELVEQAIAHFRHRGVLNASPEVREALKRKE
jgi:hypothetical protein